MTNKAQQAYNAILKQILQGELRAGEALSEAKLAHELDMTRTPVREALGVLAHEGLVDTSGRATRVRMPESDELKEHLEIRFALEMWVGLALARRRKLEGRAFDQLEQILHEMETLLDEASQLAKRSTKKGLADLKQLVQTFIQKDFEFHCQMAAEARRPKVAEYLTTYKNIFLLYASINRTSMDTIQILKEVVDEHRGILEAIRAADGQLTIQRIRNHTLGTVRRWNMKFYEEIVFELRLLEEFGLLEPS